MSIWTWLGNIFHDVKVKIAPAIVGFLNVVQGLETTGVADGVAQVIDKVFGTKLGEAANALIKANILNQIALWTGVETLSADATEDDIAKFDKAVIAAVISKKAAQSVSGEVLTAFVPQVYTIVKNVVTEAKVHETAVTAAQMVGAVEEAYQELQADITAANAAASQAETN